MQVELTDGNYDFARLQSVTDQIVHEAGTTPAVRNTFTAFRASVPQLSVKVDRTQAATLNVNAGDVYNALQSYMGSTYVNLFTKFGHNYMVYVQADPSHRLNTDDIKRLFVRGQGGNMVPIGALAEIKPSTGHPSSRSTICFPPPRSTARPPPASVPARRSRRWKPSRVKRCPPA